MVKKVISKAIGIKHNDEEMAILNFLKKETRRSSGGLYKWLAFEKAKELGFVPKKNS
jgi:hypothetical protein